IPYIPLHYQHIGLGGEQIGLLSGLGPIVLLAAGPLWGIIGDRFNLHRRLLPIASAGVILPALVISRTENLTGLITLILVQSFFATAIGPLMDSAALEIAETSQVPFGKLRLWGSIGFMLISTGLGWLLTFLPVQWLFYSYAGCMVIAVLVALPLPARKRYWSAPMWQGFRQLLGQTTLALFLGAAFLIGVAAAAVNFFFPLYIQEIGGGPELIGLAGAVGAIAEMPVLFRAESMIKRVGGLWAGVAIGAAAYTVRWWLLSLVTDPALVIALQLAHSLSFGLFLVSSVAYVESQAPPGLSATHSWPYGQVGPSPQRWSGSSPMSVEAATHRLTGPAPPSSAGAGTHVPCVA
ncbi:MAG: MFS transporter, partial [Chloroflexota bacterium]